MRSISRTINASSPLAEERTSLRHLARVRWGMLLAALLLSGVGLAMVHSAGSGVGIDYLPHQAAAVGFGLVAFLVAFGIDDQLLKSYALLVYLLGLAALVLVLVIGQEGGGARSWLVLAGVRVQPSELAKIATVLFVARTLAGANQRFLTLRQILGAGLLVAAPMALIVLERDLGGAAMLLPGFAGMLLVAGVRPRTLAAGVLVVAAAGALVWNFGMLDYQKQRVHTFLAPGSDPLGAGYQVRQSKIAVGSGELTGRGYMRGTQSQLRFLPARHTDFVFALLAEEWGFFGVVVVLALYTLYVINGAMVARRARDRTGILFVVGMLSTFAFHVLYNSAMVVGLVPITGIPLPFLSYGGSFTVANFLATGLVLGIDFRRYVNR